MAGLKAFTLWALKGIAQIMLQENAMSGLIIFLGLALGSPAYGFSALLASATGTLTAIIFKFPKDNISSGLYGFSPALVGVGLIFLLGNGWLVWLLILVGSIMATVIQNIFLSKNIPGYTFPFIITTWAIYYLSGLGQPVPPALSFIQSEINIINALIKPFSQIIFQNHVWISVLFIMAIALNSIKAALYGILASALSLILIWSGDYNSLNSGSWGYNAILTAIALSTLAEKSFMWALIGIFITLGIHYFLAVSLWLQPVGGLLTFPFVMGTWLTLMIKKLAKPF